MRIWITLLALLLCSCASRFDTPNASGRYVSSPVQCVPYARQSSGINLYGDAHTWWPQAQQKGYVCGPYPTPGAVLVLSKTSTMHYGHLAVVKRLINNREIDVTHSNWGSDWASRRIIYESMRVQDISAANDWSMVRFWNHKVKAFGFPYAVSGFIYR